MEMYLFLKAGDGGGESKSARDDLLVYLVVPCARQSLLETSGRVGLTCQFVNTEQRATLVM